MDANAPTEPSTTLAELAAASRQIYDQWLTPGAEISRAWAIRAAEQNTRVGYEVTPKHFKILARIELDIALGNAVRLVEQEEAPPAGGYEHIPAGDGLAWTNAPPRLVEARGGLARYHSSAKPGSIYYRGQSPDPDSYWRWCDLCACWHPHDPCF